MNKEKKLTLADLRLNERSLIYSNVLLECDGQAMEFLASGIQDKYSIDDLDGYSDFIEELTPLSEITVSIRSYSVGTGESENPTEEELEFIEQHEDKLEKEFGIDWIQSDSFSQLLLPDDLGLEDDEDELEQ
jgi:hypothetical protein